MKKFICFVFLFLLFFIPSCQTKTESKLNKTIINQIAKEQVLLHHTNYLEEFPYCSVEVFSMDKNKAYVFLHSTEYAIFKNKAYPLFSYDTPAIIHFSKKLEKIEQPYDEDADAWVKKHFSKNSKKLYQTYNLGNNIKKLNKKEIKDIKKEYQINVDTVNQLHISGNQYELIRIIDGKEEIIEEGKIEGNRK